MKKSVIKGLATIISVLMFLQLMIVPSLAVMAQGALDTPDATESNSDGYTIVEEVIYKRDEYTKHFICDDGSYVAVSYSDKVHYLNTENDWVEIDTERIILIRFT